MTIEKHSEEPHDVWERFARLTGLFQSGDSYLCVQHCSVQPQCVENCRAADDDSEWEEDGGSLIMSADAVKPLNPKDSTPKNSPVKAIPTGDEAHISAFQLRWANLSGLEPNPGLGAQEEKMHHSVLPLTSMPQDAGKQRAGFPTPRFFSGIPIKAYMYKANASDAIDVELQGHLQALSDVAQHVLALRRVQAGKYEIYGRQVQVYRGGKDGVHAFVREDEVNACGIEDMPLKAYINLVATVAVSLQRPGVAPTFVDTGSVALNKIRDDTDDRYRAMRIACTQAELRNSGQYLTAST